MDRDGSRSAPKDGADHGRPFRIVGAGPERGAAAPAPSEHGFETAAAAALLGINPQILRLWVQRYGLPRSGRGPDGRRRFDAAEVYALHDALARHASVAEAIHAVAHRPGSAQPDTGS